MKVAYDHVGDVLLIEFSSNLPVKTKTLHNDLMIVEYDAQGKLVTIEVVSACQQGMDPLNISIEQFTSDYPPQLPSESEIKIRSEAKKQVALASSRVTKSATAGD
jgi:uncharacterized protein YuzE